MAAGPTYEPIASTTLTSAAATITFNSIPSTYTDLVIIALMKNSGSGGDFLARVNGDANANYSRTILGANKSSEYSARATSDTKLRFNYSEPITSDGNTTYTIELINYSNTDINKTFISRAGKPNSSLSEIINVWRNNVAITSIEFYTDSTNFASGSTITLYGIAAA